MTWYSIYSLIFIFSMGSQNSKFLRQQELPHQFRPLKQYQGVYQSILNGTRIQRHKIQLNSEAQINYEKDIFIFRRMHADRIISAYYFQKFVPGHFCNMSYQVCFFTEYPSYVMSYNLGFSFQLGLQLLIQCLKGFQILFAKFGPFTINFDNIFFDAFHQPKVWISSDLGKTRIEKYLKNNQTQQKMIIDLFRVFDQSKNERNSYLTYMSLLKKQQHSKTLTFKNTIINLIDQASNLILIRNKSLSNGLHIVSRAQVANYSNLKGQKLPQSRSTFKRQQKQMSQLSNKLQHQSRNHHKNNSFLSKQNNSTISLKNRVKNDYNRNESKAKNISHQTVSNNRKVEMVFNNKVGNNVTLHQNQKNISHNFPPYYYSPKQNEMYKQSVLKNNNLSTQCSSTGFQDQKQSHHVHNCSNLARQKKWKRHNSQQDCKTKQFLQLKVFKQNNQTQNYPMGYHHTNQKQNFNPPYVKSNTNNFLTAQKLQKSNLLNLKNRPIKVATPNGIRFYRKSLQQFPICYFNNSVKRGDNQINIVKATAKDSQIHQHRIIQNFMHTRIEQEAQNQMFTQRNIYSKNQRKTSKDCRNTESGKKQKKIIFQFQNRQMNAGVSLKQLERCSRKTWKNSEQKPMALNKLETLKSIINSDYSDMDSQIRQDLKNLQF